MISIESVPVTPAWFEDLFGKPPYADGLSGSGSMDDGSIMAYTMEQIMNGSNHQFRATTPYWSISRQLYMNCTGNDTIGANMSIRDSSSVIPTLYDTDGGFVCSGTLIHPHWVLTSASCARVAEDIEVFFSFRPAHQPRSSTATYTSLCWAVPVTVGHGVRVPIVRDQVTDKDADEWHAQTQCRWARCRGAAKRFLWLAR